MPRTLTHPEIAEQLQRTGTLDFSESERRGIRPATDPCPVCSGQRREADGTFTIRQPLWEYVVEVLRAWVDDAESSVTGKGDLLRLAAEIEREVRK